MSIFWYVLSAVLLLFALLIFPRKKQTKKFGITLLALALLLEIFVFNFHSFHLVGGDYKETKLDLNSAQVVGFDKDGEGLTSNADLTQTILEFKGVGKKIGTVKIDVEYTTDGESLDLLIDASDETNSASYRTGVASATFIRGDDRSECVILDLSGEVSNLRLRFSSDKGQGFKINSITINAPKAMELSAIRLLAIVGFAFALYALLCFPSMRMGYESEKKLFGRCAAVMTFGFVAVAVALTVLYNMDNYGRAFSGFAQTSGNQITKELVDAFKAGQVHLLDAPSKELLALENPYDWSLRDQVGVSYKWDHLLFDGKYYSYYGIAPVLLLFLPYNLITGYYFPTPEAVLVFGAIGIVFLSLLLVEIIKRFFKKLPIGIAICSLAILQLCSGIMYCFCSPLFYEIAQASGFMFTMMGAYFLVRSGVVGEGRISRVSLIASATCLSLAVLCRPTLALYCVAALVFIGFGFFKNLKQTKDDGQKVVASSVGYLACALTAFAVIGGIQMAYNYVRFGSILDFGIQYSLTINDFTRAQYHTDFAMVGFWNYLFAFPQVKFEFPFVFSNFSDLDVNGYYFIANRNAVGLFWRALPMFGYVGAVTAYRKIEKKKRLPALLVILSACVIAPLIIIFSIWESGYGVRYSADFAVELILGGMMIIYFLCLTRKRDRSTVMSFAHVFFVISALVALVVNFAMIYDYMSKDGQLTNAFLDFERIFEFWR